MLLVNKHKTKHGFHKAYLFLQDLIPIITIGVLIFFGVALIGLQKDNQRILEGMNNTVQNTERIAIKQDETLKAIQELALDNKLTSKRLGDAIICMLKTPFEQRTADRLKDCRAEAMANSPDPPGFPPQPRIIE